MQYMVSVDHVYVQFMVKQMKHATVCQQYMYIICSLEMMLSCVVVVFSKKKKKSHKNDLEW